MNAHPTLLVERTPAYVIARCGGAAALPLVFDSPHSGTLIPPDIRTVASEAALQSGWDAWVDELWAGAPAQGGALLAATFHRMYIDANRARDDIDPELLGEPWPGELRPSEYSRRGMGLVRRLALPGQPMYERKLTATEVSARIEGFYDPYHRALHRLLDDACRRWGRVWHVDCHSMKSVGNGMNADAGSARPDFVVSDRDGTTSDPGFTHWVAERIAQMGYSVKVNEPYKGGELVRRFGDPSAGRHSLQIEISRLLYMDESRAIRHGGFPLLKSNLDQLARQLAEYVKVRLH
jgi:N-formylglutamate deformylase